MINSSSELRAHSSAALMHAPPLGLSCVSYGVMVGCPVYFASSFAEDSSNLIFDRAMRHLGVSYEDLTSKEKLLYTTLKVTIGCAISELPYTAMGIPPTYAIDALYVVVCVLDEEYKLSERGLAKLSGIVSEIFQKNREILNSLEGSTEGELSIDSEVQEIVNSSLEQAGFKQHLISTIGGRRLIPESLSMH